MGRSVAETQAAVDSREFSGWLAYQAIVGPLGPEREDRRAALIAMMIANGNRDSKKRRKPYEIDDFMLYRAAPEEPDEDALERKIMTAFGAWMAEG